MGNTPLRCTNVTELFIPTHKTGHSGSFRKNEHVMRIEEDISEEKKDSQGTYKFMVIQILNPLNP
jgi:hypothetical protein